MAVAASLKYFDTHEYVKKSREFGASEQLAEYQVTQIEKAIEVAVKFVKDDMKSEELATKKDLEVVKLELQKEIEIVRKEIVQAKNQTLLWTFGMLTGFAVFFLGVLAKGFHWL